MDSKLWMFIFQCLWNILESVTSLPHRAVLLSSNSNTNGYWSSTLNFADIPCGQRPNVRYPRIIGGENALESEFPWSVSIQSIHGGHFCGGVIISSTHILTVAHCFIHYFYGDKSVLKSTRLISGTTSLLHPNRREAQTRKIHKLTLHPNFTYFFPEFANDIAIIELNKELNWSESIQPACLSSDFRERLGTAIVAGWGSTGGVGNEEFVVTNQLQKVTMPLWSNERCQKAYNDEGIEWVTKSSHVCAGYAEGQKDSCKGDSGSAIMTNVNVARGKMEWIAYGLTSGGKGCAMKGLPGIYTRVSYFVPWIKTIIN